VELYNLFFHFAVSNNIFTFLTNSIRVFPLSTTIRTQITSAIQSNCSKIKNLVFAVLIANNKLIALVRMKKYSIHPADLRLIFNLVECSESFKSSENWSPICLPKFDMNGYFHTCGRHQVCLHAAQLAHPGGRHQEQYECPAAATPTGVSHFSSF